MLGSVIALILGISNPVLGASGSSFQDAQEVLAASPGIPGARVEHVVDEAIIAALGSHSDPVAALVSLQPAIAADLAKPRLLHVFGEQKPKWMTEGDKLRLRRKGKKFADITDHQDFYAQQAETSLAGKASKSAPISTTHVNKFCLRNG